MAGRRIAGGALVLNAEGLSKLAAGDARVRGYLDSARARGTRVAVSALTGELLGSTGLSGHRRAIDAVVAATALDAERPVVLLTSDPDDMNRLVSEPDRPKTQRVVVVPV